MRINVLYVAVLFLLINGCGDADKEKERELWLACVRQIFPANGAPVAPGSTLVFSWEESVLADSYDVFLGVGTNEPTLIASDLTTRTYTYTAPPDNNVSYTWYIKAKKSDGSYVDCRESRNVFNVQDIPAHDEQSRVVKVLVLSYDPELSFNGGPGIKLHSFLGGFDPRWLADEYTKDVLTSSDSLIQYQVVEWRDIDVFPAKKDGFVYTDSSYFLCMFGGDKTKCHKPDDMDYMKMIQEQKIVDGIDQDKYEEVWIFGAPYFGFWESAMAGLNPFYINGGIFEQVPTKKAFAIMGFSYEREPAEMLHNLCHRTEATMSQVYGGWSAEQLTTSWAKFAANSLQSGTAAVGSCHFPANAIFEYDYANTHTPVMSTADDWYNYPMLTGNKRSISAAEWGAPDYQRSYLRWWFNHLPRRVGTGPDGKLNCWWRYVFEFDERIIKNK